LSFESRLTKNIQRPSYKLQGIYRLVFMNVLAIEVMEIFKQNILYFETIFQVVTRQKKCHILNICALAISTGQS
jgi:hypothetical protein